MALVALNRSPATRLEFDSTEMELFGLMDATSKDGSPADGAAGCCAARNHGAENAATAATDRTVEFLGCSDMRFRRLIRSIGREFCGN